MLLSNGRLTTRIAENGTGHVELDGYALTRWRPDRTRETDGFHLYIRDLDTSEIWSAALEPVERDPDSYSTRFQDGVAEILRMDRDIETKTEVSVARDANLELRRFALTNRGHKTVNLDVTTYAEVVLNTAAADAAHPAFSKLFVQTEFVPTQQALIAKRRLRSPEDVPLWLGHVLRVENSNAGGRIEYETSRMRFIGRGRTCARPAALDAGACLSATVGNVLDPIISLRRRITIAAGAAATLVCALAAGNTRAEVERALEHE